MENILENQLLTAEEVAERIQVSPRKVVEWSRDGLIPELRLSTRIRRYEWSAVLKAVRARESNQEERCE